jgi:hypothetical protein
LEEGRYLKVLDLSWNALGDNAKATAILSGILAEHRYLAHVDLSFCRFTYGESLDISSGL